MAPVANRRTMLAADSTSSTRTGGVSCSPAASSTPRMRSSPRSVISRRDWSSTRLVYSLKISYRRLRVACCSLKTASGLNRCGSPSRRHWYSPPVSSRRKSIPAPAPVAWPVRRLISSASWSKPTPDSREVVPAKQASITSGPRPMASKICAPV